MNTVDLQNYYDIERVRPLLGVRYFNFHWLRNALYAPKCHYETVCKITFGVEFEVSQGGISGEIQPISGVLSEGRFDGPTFLSSAAIDDLLGRRYVSIDTVLDEIKKHIVEKQRYWETVKNDYRPPRYIQDHIKAWQGLYAGIESDDGIVLIDSSD